MIMHYNYRFCYKCTKYELRKALPYVISSVQVCNIIGNKHEAARIFRDMCVGVVNVVCNNYDRSPNKYVSYKINNNHIIQLYKKAVSLVFNCYLSDNYVSIIIFIRIHFY